MTGRRPPSPSEVSAGEAMRLAALEAKLRAMGRSRRLRPGLYRVDLGAIVSKYVGETERRLAPLFCAVSQAGAVLLLDEADALLGRRGDVRDAHDRYADLEWRLRPPRPVAKPAAAA